MHNRNPTPMSANQWSQQQYGMSNFNQAFAQSTNIIDRPDYTNRGNVIHNNLGANLLQEHISEYKLRLSSADRNISMWPSIFRQVIVFDNSTGCTRSFKNVKYVSIESIILPKSFAIDISKIFIPSTAFDSSKNLINKSICCTDIYPANSSYLQNYDIIGLISGNLTWNESINSSGYFTGTIITTSVTNLTGTFTGTMYISSFDSGTNFYSGTFTGSFSGTSENLQGSFNGNITAGILSGVNFTGVLTCAASALPSSNLASISWTHPVIYLKVEELSSDKNIGSSTILSNNTFTFRYDASLGHDMTLWKPISGSTTIYPSSRLSNLSKLNLTILDENGQELHLTDLQGNKIVNTPLYFLNPNISSSYIGDYNNFIQMFNSTSSVKYTGNITQVSYNFTVGVVENELNTQTNY
jgi:hypothetical protein